MSGMRRAVLLLTCLLVSRHAAARQAAPLDAVPLPPAYVDVSTLTEHAVSRAFAAATAALTTAPEQDKLAGPQLRHHLPECATQQVCNTLFVRMNHTQRLCECSRNYNWECNSDPFKEDGHTIELTRRYDKKVYTQVKLCEPLGSIRACKTPTDWTLLALQSERTGKAHYVVVCRCPENSLLDGPYTHNHPPYARIPGEADCRRAHDARSLAHSLSPTGIRVYGMLCSQNNRTRRERNGGGQSGQRRAALPPSQETRPDDYPAFPWEHAFAVLNSSHSANLWQ